MHTATIITQVDRLPKPMKESHASASLRGNRPCPHIAFSSLQARCRRASPATVVPLRRRTVTAAAPSAIAHGEDLLELLSLFLHSQRWTVHRSDLNLKLWWAHLAGHGRPELKHDPWPVDRVYKFFSTKINPNSQENPRYLHITPCISNKVQSSP
jgi:hypothetical protein